MRKILHDDHHYVHQLYLGGGKKRYGFFKFLFDCAMTLVTGGLWLIWVLVRELRNLYKIKHER